MVLESISYSGRGGCERGHAHALGKPGLFVSDKLELWDWYICLPVCNSNGESERLIHEDVRVIYEGPRDWTN